MRMIISPAKAMRIRQDLYKWQDIPEFLDKAEQIREKLAAMDYDALKALWKCNDEIAKLNYQRLARMELDKELSPAILSYDGIQYQSMRNDEFNHAELEYLQEHLRIISGFYGVLKPLDGIRPYRLEMQAKLQIAGAKDLYAFWGSAVADNIGEDCDCVINLASKEYSRCVSRFLPGNCRFINCLFGEEKEGKIVEKGTMCKIARGEMVRWMAENKVEKADQLSGFQGTYHKYCPEFSSENTYVFIKK